MCFASPVIPGALPKRTERAGGLLSPRHASTVNWEGHISTSVCVVVTKRATIDRTGASGTGTTASSFDPGPSSAARESMPTQLTALHTPSQGDSAAAPPEQLPALPDIARAGALPPSPVKPATPAPAPGACTSATGVHPDPSAPAGIGAMGAALRWGAALLVGAGMLSLAAVAAATTMSPGGASTAVPVSSWWGFWSFVLALLALTIVFELSEAGTVAPCKALAAVLALAMCLRRQARRSRAASVAASCHRLPAEHVAAPASTTLRTEPCSAIISTNLFLAPAAEDQLQNSEAAASGAATPASIDLASLHQLLRQQRQASQQQRLQQQRKQQMSRVGCTPLYTAQLRHVPVAAKVHDHPTNFTSYATRLSDEVTSATARAIAQQALRPGVQLQQQQRRLPMLVKSIVVEGCVQLVAWAVSAAAQLVPSARAGRHGDSEQRHAVEQDIMDAVLSGSPLLHGAASATMQVGGSVAAISANGRDAEPRVAHVVVSPDADDTQPDLQPLFAWPCCLEVARQDASNSGADSGSSRGQAGASAVVEVQLAPALAAAAAGVRQVSVRVLLTSGTELLSDNPLLLETANPVARIPLPGSVTASEGVYELCILSGDPSDSLDADFAQTSTARARGTGEGTRRASDGSIMQDSAQSMFGGSHHQGCKAGDDLEEEGSMTQQIGPLPPAGCVLASMPLLVMTAAATRELDVLLEVMASQEQERQETTHASQQQAGRQEDAAVPGGPVQPAPSGSLFGGLCHALGLGRAPASAASSIPPAACVPCAALSAEHPSAVAWRLHWLPLVEDLSFVMGLASRGSMGVVEMGQEGAGELALIAATLLQYLLDNSCFATAASLLSAACTAGLPFSWQGEQVPQQQLAMLSAGNLQGLVQLLAGELEQAAADAAAAAAEFAAAQQSRDAAGQLPYHACAGHQGMPPCCATGDVNAPLMQLDLFESADGCSLAAPGCAEAKEMPRAPGSSGARRYSSVEALLYAVPRLAAHTARRPSYVGAVALAAGEGVDMATGDEGRRCSAGMVWHILTPRRTRRRLFSATEDDACAGDTDSDCSFIVHPGGVSDQVLADFRRMSGEFLPRSLAPTDVTAAGMGHEGQQMPCQAGRQRRMGALWAATTSGLADAGLFGRGDGRRLSAASYGSSDVSSDRARRLPVARYSSTDGGRSPPGSPQPPCRRPPSSTSSGSTQDALLTEAVRMAAAAPRQVAPGPGQSEPLVVLLGGGRAGAPGDGSSGLLAPRVTHRLALQGFGVGFTPRALEQAFLRWRNALHADIDGVSLLVLVALHLLTLVKGSGGSRGGAASTLLRMLSPAAAASGLHWAVACVAVVALAHALMLSSPNFMCWYVVKREPFCLASEALQLAVLLAGALACERPIPDGSMGILKLVLLASCGSLFYIQLRAVAFLAQLAMKLAALYTIVCLLVPSEGWWPMFTSITAAGALAAWVMFANSIRSRQRFLEQCVRPAALMLPEGGGGGVSGGSAGGAAQGAGGVGSNNADPLAGMEPMTPVAAPRTPYQQEGPSTAAPGSAGSFRGDSTRMAGAPYIDTPAAQVHGESAAARNAAGASMGGLQVFLPVGYRERSCMLLMKDTSTADAVGGQGLANSPVPGCRLTRMELLLRSTLPEAHQGFWGSPGVAAVCAALRQTPPVYQRAGLGSSGAMAGALADDPAHSAAGRGGTAGPGAFGVAVNAPPGYQEMQCVLLMGLEGCNLDGGSEQLPTWLAQGSVPSAQDLVPSGTRAAPMQAPAGGSGASPMGATSATGGAALYHEVRCVLFVREGSIRLLGQPRESSGAGAGVPLGLPNAAAGVTGGAGRAPRAAVVAHGRQAGRRRSSASIVECVRAAASALAEPPALGGPEAAAAGGRWMSSMEEDGGIGPGGPPPLASFGLRERFVSLLVKEPAVSLASDYRLMALLPGFTELRVTVLARV